MSGEIVFGLSLFFVIIGAAAILIGVVPGIFFFKTASEIKKKLSSEYAAHQFNALVVMIVCTIVAFILSLCGSSYTGFANIAKFIASICNIVFAVNLYKAVKDLCR